MGENGVMGGGGMSPADFAALMNRNYGNDMWGNNNALWIVFLFALFCGGNGFGFGNNGFQNAIGYENLATSNEVQRGFDSQNTMANEREILASVNSNSVQGMQNANTNTQYITGTINDKYSELSRDINNLAMMGQQSMANQNECCCSTKMLIQNNTAELAAGLAQNRYDGALNMSKLDAAIAQVRYENAMNTASIVQAIHEDGALTRAQAQQKEIDRLQRQVDSLNLQSQLAGVVRYPMSTTYNAGFNPYCTCPGMM